MKEPNSDQKGSISTISESTAGFRSIFKATSIFGGVQVFNIIFSLIRGKVLAILIGPSGMGLNGLLISSITLIDKATGLGLEESAIRDISLAHSSNDKKRIRVVRTVFHRWIWLTALVGVVLTIALSPLLSRLAFEDDSHTISFKLLSVTFIFGALTGGIYTLLRGMRRIKDLAKASIFGSSAGLMVSLPIFYFMGINGVVPSIIATSAVAYLVSLYYIRKFNVKAVKISIKDTFLQGKQMVSLGITLTFSAMVGAGITFLINSYISKVGSLEDLGIFNAGNSIIGGYIGMVFTALGTDYYPRLAGVINNPKEWKTIVNQQAEIVVLILGPILAFILLSAPVLIKVLLSEEFLSSIDFIIWASLSVILRGITWISGFIFIAKGDNKVFLITELAAQVWFLFFNILFFNLYGIKGLGISMIINYLLSVIMMYFVLKLKYKFILSKDTYKLSGIFLFLIALTVLVINIYNYPFAFYFAGIIFLISILFSIRELNKRMNFMQFIKKYIDKT